MLKRKFVWERLNSDLIGAVVLVLVVSVIYRLLECGFVYDTCYWREWTGFGNYVSPKGEFTRSKTLWDVMSLVVVPLALAITVWLLNRSQERSKQSIELDKQRQTALEN